MVKACSHKLVLEEIARLWYSARHKMPTTTVIPLLVSVQAEIYVYMYFKSNVEATWKYSHLEAIQIRYS